MNPNPTTLSVDEKFNEIFKNPKRLKVAMEESIKEQKQYSKKVSVDEQIDKILSHPTYMVRNLGIDIGDEIIYHNKKACVRIKSLIKDVCEESLPMLCGGSLTAYDKGWNDCISEQRTKLNKIIGEKK